MSGKNTGVLIGVAIISIFVLIVILKWDSIKSMWTSATGLKACKDLSAFDCVKEHGARKTTAGNAGDRYDYPDTSNGSYGFYSNDRVVMIGTSPAKKGSYDKKQITWDDGDKILMKDIFKS